MWLRFAIIGPLSAAPPEPGKLRQALNELVGKTWKHPVHGTPVRFSFATLERWYYAVPKAQDPVAALRRPRRHDAGRPRRLSAAVSQALAAQYRKYQTT